MIFRRLLQHDFGGSSEASFLGDFYSMILGEHLKHNFG